MTDEQQTMKDFEQLFMPLAEAHKHLNYNAQYARVLIINTAIVGEDLFDVHGRWFVSKAFIQKLGLGQGRSG